MSASAQHAPRRTLSELKVLIVDDSPHMLAMLRRVLTDMNIRDLTVAGDGDAGLSELQRLGPDFAFVDWSVKPGDGREFVRRVRALPDTSLAETPIIMMAAQSDSDRVKDARDAGINAFLAKPATVQAVMNRVLWVLSDARPFIRSPRYTGPDRRTRFQHFAGEERRHAARAPAGSPGFGPAPTQGRSRRAAG